VPAARLVAGTSCCTEHDACCLLRGQQPAVTLVPTVHVADNIASYI
jgi:hypothetical protein